MNVVPFKVNCESIMIHYSKHILNNGLRVLLHCDNTTPLVTVNLLYCVGARDESPDLTGFAHLFEHLMFGGTKQYPDYDRVVDSMGGDNNAFTNNDYTNYYLTVPAQYLEQALALESDRLHGNWDIIDGHWNVLDVQKRVVTEEFNQRYMNRPYGNVWLLLRPLCYRVHPYRWCTIGADIKHVQNATLMDVQKFFNRFYRPDNAILSIAGNFNPEQTLLWVEKLFGSILPSSPSMLLPVPKRKYPSEPEQTAPRRKEVVCNVPNDALYMAWHMCNRWSPLYYTYDMVSDILSNGHSSRLYQRLVQQEHLFTEINAYITGDLDQGLFVVSGKLCSGIDPHMAENAVNQELLRLQQEPVSAHEIQKVANKFENNFLFSQYKASDRALSLCYFEMIESPDLVNSEPDNYRTITPEDIQRVSLSFSPDRCSTLIIRKQSSDN